MSPILEAHQRQSARATPYGKQTRRPARGAASFKVVASTKRPLRVMISGAPAAGKGTQCAKIIEKEVKQGTPAGKKAKDFMDSGVLVPNEVVVEMVKNRLAQDDVKQNGWLLDGYPRSASQAEAIEKEGIRPDVFLLIEVPSELLIERVVGRRLDPVTGEIYHLKYKAPPPEIVPRLQQRSDDTEEKARTRLQTHYSNVDAVLGYYKNEIVQIDGNRSMDQVFKSVCEAIDATAARVNA